MELTPYDILEDDTKQIVRDTRGALDKIGPIFRILMQEGYPVREHWERLVDACRIQEKNERVFNLTPPETAQVFRIP